MKKLIAISLCAIMALSFAACSKDKPAPEEEIPAVGQDSANPFVDCETIADAEKLTGFSLTLPAQMPEGYTQTVIQVMDDSMIQVIFENGDNSITVRKAKGSEDISGDSSEYAESKTLTIDSVEVSAKGNDGKISTATWVDGEYTYAVSVGADEAGLDEAVISEMISSIK